MSVLPSALDLHDDHPRARVRVKLCGQPQRDVGGDVVLVDRLDHVADTARNVGHHVESGRGAAASSAWCMEGPWVTAQGPSHAELAPLRPYGVTARGVE